MRNQFTQSESDDRELILKSLIVLSVCVFVTHNQIFIASKAKVGHWRYVWVNNSEISRQLLSMTARMCSLRRTNPPSSLFVVDKMSLNLPRNRGLLSECQSYC